MKAKIIFLFLIILIISSCKKDKPTLPISLIGKWNWIYYTLDYPDPNGNGPMKITPASAGYTEFMEFTVENNWKKSVDNVVIDSGTFILEHKSYTNSSNYTYKYDQITYNRNGAILGEDYYEINNNNLIFNPALRGFYASLNVSFLGGTKWFIKQ